MNIIINLSHTALPPCPRSPSPSTPVQEVCEQVRQEDPQADWIHEADGVQAVGIPLGKHGGDEGAKGMGDNTDLNRVRIEEEGREEGGQALMKKDRQGWYDEEGQALQQLLQLLATTHTQLSPFPPPVNPTPPPHQQPLRLPWEWTA